MSNYVIHTDQEVLWKNEFKIKSLTRSLGVRQEICRILVKKPVVLSSFKEKETGRQQAC